MNSGGSRIREHHFDYPGTCQQGPRIPC